MWQPGSAYTFGNIFLMLAFISLPMGMYLVLVFAEFSGDVIDGNMLLLQAQTSWDSTVYCIAFFLNSLIAANIIRMLVAVYTDYEIALWITREIYKQNVDDERTARRYDRDRQVLAAYKEAYEVTRHTTGVQELVEEVFTQVTTDDNPGKTHDDFLDAEKPKNSSKKSKKSFKFIMSRKAVPFNKSTKFLTSAKSKKGINMSSKITKQSYEADPLKRSAKSNASSTQQSLNNRDMPMIGSLSVKKTQRSFDELSLKTTQTSNLVDLKTLDEPKTQSLTPSVNETQNTD